MQFKKACGKIFDINLTAKEREALRLEINKQILEADKNYNDNLDALILWTLHTYLGFGPKRLRDFYEKFHEIHQDMRNYYELSAEDMPWVYMQKLKDIGVDIVQWNKEKQNG